MIVHPRGKSGPGAGSVDDPRSVNRLVLVRWIVERPKVDSPIVGGGIPEALDNLLSLLDRSPCCSGLLSQEVVDGASQPVGIAPVVLAACGDEKGTSVLGVFLKIFSWHVLVVTETPFFAPQDLGTGLLPGTPTGQRS
jgi:hypothetical protein